MAKYSRELEKQVLEVFEKNTLVTSDMIQHLDMTPAVILRKLMDNSIVLRREDPMHYKRYVYFLVHKKNKAEEEIQHRKKQSLRKKHKDIQNRILGIERAKAHHLKLIRKYDGELKELREKEKFLQFLISP